MSENMSYKGYSGSVEYSAEDRTLHGRLLGIRDIVTFGGADVQSVECGFRAAVDEYLALCAETGKEPAQPYKGTFNVRTGMTLHRRAALYAEQNRLKLNQVVKQALEQYLDQAGARTNRNV